MKHLYSLYMVSSSAWWALKNGREYLQIDNFLCEFRALRLANGIAEFRD